MSSELPAPDKEQIAALPEFERLRLDRIEWVASAEAAKRAAEALSGIEVLGFDTESKPTFSKGEASDGPHIVQLASAERAWIFQLTDPTCREVAARLLASPESEKVGFGLFDDLRRIHRKLGVEMSTVIDINQLFRQRGYRKEIGVKTAVALVFGKRFAKSSKASTSNWAAPRLSESQLLYAANDAWAALRVFQALRTWRPPPPVRS